MIKLQRNTNNVKRQIFKRNPFEEQYIHYTTLKANGKQAYLHGHFNVRANSESVSLLPASGTPGREESVDGNRLISFSLSIFLFSVGIKDLFSGLGGSTSSSFPESAILEADVPSKKNKGKMKITRENTA